MKFTVALFTLAVVCCAQTLAQGLGRLGNGDRPRLGRWGIFRDHPRVPTYPIFPSSFPPWIFDFPPVTTPPTTPHSVGGPGGPGGLPFPVPGGLQEVTEITQEHKNLATFAATEIGREYTLNNVTRVQTQVVAGINYHMDISVTKTKGLVQTSLNCEVKIYHILWMDEMTLEEFKCIRVTSVQIQRLVRVVY